MVSYLKKGDTKAQKEYLKQKRVISSNADNKQKSSSNDADHSWDFLNDTMNRISERFSKQDIQNLLNTGKELKEQGVQYQHDKKLVATRTKGVRENEKDKTRE